jgi:hypothetical protein
MKTRHIPLLTIVAALALSILACNALTPRLPATPPTAAAEVLFQDDFSDSDSGWDRVSIDRGETDYVEGGYRIFVNTANLDVWANPGLHFDDVRVEADVAVVGGDPDNSFGLICRAAAPDQFYWLAISSDGYYGIGKIAGENQSLIGSESMQSTDQFQPNQPSYHLRADCIGDRLTLYVDGVQIAEVQDQEYISGDVGLIAGAFETPGVDVRFDNFTVLQP